MNTSCLFEAPAYVPLTLEEVTAVVAAAADVSAEQPKLAVCYIQPIFADGREMGKLSASCYAYSLEDYGKDWIALKPVEKLDGVCKKSRLVHIGNPITGKCAACGVECNLKDNYCYKCGREFEDDA